VVYDGGVLASGEVAAITLQDGELAGYEFAARPAGGGSHLFRDLQAVAIGYPAFGSCSP